MDDRPYLRSLADHLGILPAYVDICGVERVTEDATRTALLSAMGFDGSTEAAAGRALEGIERSERQRLMAPVRVVVAQAEKRPEVPLTVPGHDLSPVDWQIELCEEGGRSHVASGRAGATDVSEGPAGGSNSSQYTIDGECCTLTFNVSLPVSPPPGYHTLRASVSLPGRTLEAEQSFIVSPGQCTSLSKRVGERPDYGLWANLYTVRSRRNWGVGDLTDLGELVDRAGGHGAAFVGVNPLHALRNRDDHISPYCPVSRLFRNVIYLDVEAVPEFSGCREAQALLESQAFRTELADVRSAGHVRYERVADLKDRILRLLHAAFWERQADSSADRARAYAQYVAAQGKALVDYATFVALDCWLTEGSAGPAWRAGSLVETVGSVTGWRDWPAMYRSPNSPEVRAFRDEHRHEVDYHCFVQFELDRQLAEAARGLGPDSDRCTKLRLGIYQDLAVGSAGGGSDAWSFPDLFVDGAEVGAPPDPYCESGQTWGFPPVDPRRLTATGYDYWIQLVQSAMAHAGMLRVDHVMGLFRQFWVPTGWEAKGGAYVRFPAEDLLGILALESSRHGTVVVGEDLGTVPPEVPPALEKWQILSSSVMYFERDGGGEFRSAGSYSPRALVTATTHDHAPLAGFWTGRDLDCRHEIGLYSSGADLENARAQRASTRAALLRLFVETGLLPRQDGEGGEATTVQSVIAAAYAFLSKTPCPLVGVSLDDLACETDPVNLPGVVHAKYASWSRRMRCYLEEIFDDEGVRRILDQIEAALIEQRP